MVIGQWHCAPGVFHACGSGWVSQENAIVESGNVLASQAGSFLRICNSLGMTRATQVAFVICVNLSILLSRERQFGGSDVLGLAWVRDRTYSGWRGYGINRVCRDREELDRHISSFCSASFEAPLEVVIRDLSDLALRWQGETGCFHSHSQCSRGDVSRESHSIQCCL